MPVNEVVEQLLWDMLPTGLSSWFKVERYEKTELVFRIWLTERNLVPEQLPAQYRGKKVVNTYTREITVDDFPVRGRKGELIVKRRSWKFEGVAELYRRELALTASDTKVEKEFAVFLKELDRIGARRYQYRSPGKPSASSDTGGTIQGRVQ